MARVTPQGLPIGVPAILESLKAVGRFLKTAGSLFTRLDRAAKSIANRWCCYFGQCEK
jgi:hypothetical protein